MKVTCNTCGSRFHVPGMDALSLNVCPACTPTSMPRSAKSTKRKARKPGSPRKPQSASPPEVE